MPCRSCAAAAVGFGCRCRAQPFGGNLGECPVEFDAGEVPPELPGGQAGRAGAAERVENGSARLAASLDAAQREINRERGEVRASVGTGGDRPDVAGVASGRVGGVPLADAVAAGTSDLQRVRAVLRRPGACGGPVAGLRVALAGFPPWPATAPCTGRAVACGMRMGSRSNQ